MGFSVQSIEYMNNSWAQTDGSRALGNTGSANYWTRLTIRTDAAGSTGASIVLDIETFGAYTYREFAAGAQAIISTSPSPGSYVGTTPNLAAQQPALDKNQWIFSGAVAANMQANTTYYILILPCWSTPDRFARYTRSLSTISTADWPSYALGISAGTGSSISVYRNASSLGAATGWLGNGSTIYYGDTLTVNFAASVGYRLTSTTVNGSPFASGSALTVTGTVTAASAATRLSYTLTITADANSIVTVKRGGSTLPSGSTIYYGDTLSVTASAKSGYEVASAKINGVAFSGTKSVSVTGAVAVVVTSSALGFAYIRRNGSWTPYLIYIRVNGTWRRYRAYVSRNGVWRAY